VKTFVNVGIYTVYVYMYVCVCVCVCLCQVQKVARNMITKYWLIWINLIIYVFRETDLNKQVHQQRIAQIPEYNV